MKKLLITGGNGFVGHHVIEHVLKNTDWFIYNIDKMSYASEGFNRLKDINVYDSKRVLNFYCDLSAPLSFGVKKEIGVADYVINIASESHVDNSIENPVPFVLNNVRLTLSMLEYIRENPVQKFVNFSCYDIKTRAVTLDGLKYYDQLTTNDFVLTLNEKKIPEFQKIEKIHLKI